MLFILSVIVVLAGAFGLYKLARTESGRKALSRVAASVGLLAPAISFAQSSTSYLPSSASGLFTQMQSDFTTLFGLAFGVMVFIVGSLLAWRYTRKLGSKV